VLDPKITAELDRLRAKIRELAVEVEQRSARLIKTIDEYPEDYLEVVWCMDTLSKKSAQIVYLSGKLEALRNVEYL
jgi:uncharacterized protein YdhG (YjbR/CyaY superfamily)